MTWGPLVMRERLLWDRFLIHWLPPDKVAGNTGADIGRAFATTYQRDDGKATRFNYMGAAFAVITAGRTVVLADVPPLGNLPAWLEVLPKNQAKVLRPTTRKWLADKMVPHFWLEFGRTFHTSNSPVLGGGTQIVISRPEDTTYIDLVRIERAKQAIKALGSKKRARDVARLLDRRMTVQDTSDINTKLRGLARKSKLSMPAFFDAAEAAIGITNIEWELAT